MSNTTVGPVYDTIIAEVINAVRVDFEENGVDDGALEDLKKVRLSQSLFAPIASRGILADPCLCVPCLRQSDQFISSLGSERNPAMHSTVRPYFVGLALVALGKRRGKCRASLGRLRLSPRARGVESSRSGGRPSTFGSLLSSRPPAWSLAQSLSRRLPIGLSAPPSRAQPWR